MGRRGRIQYRLTGSYTRYGYFSFVPQLVKGLQNLWVLKGPAGSGESGFIRSLGENLADRGYEVEFWLSAMEPGSAEGIFIPHLSAAVVNGSLIQPVDYSFSETNVEVVNLSEGFNAVKIEEWHQELAAMSARILHHNRLAENFIENSLCLEACSIDERSCRIDRDRLAKKIMELEAAVFNPVFQERHFYACSLTVDGIMDYVKDLSSDCQKRYILHGPPGCGQEEVLAGLVNKARQMGMRIEHYHWALDPEKTCLILLPQLRTALLEDAFLGINKQPGDIVIDMSIVLKPGFDDREFEKHRQRTENLFLQVQVELEEVYKSFREMKRIQAASIDHSWMERKQDDILRKMIKDEDY